MEFNKIDLYKILYEKPFNFKSNITYKYNQIINLIFVSPKLKVLKIIKSKDKSYILVELNKTHNDFYEFLRKLDELNISNSYCNSNEWFSKEIPLNIIEDYYKSPIRLGKKSNIYYLKLNIESIEHNIEKDKYYKFNLNYKNLNFYKQDFYPSIIIEEYNELPEVENNLFLNNNLENDFSFEQLEENTSELNNDIKEEDNNKELNSIEENKEEPKENNNEEEDKNKEEIPKEDNDEEIKEEDEPIKENKEENIEEENIEEKSKPKIKKKKKKKKKKIIYVKNN